jgi:SAM-dependent methyltransferase
MAQYGSDFGGTMPEYYDRILVPAQFGPLADDLARRLPRKPVGDVLEIACGTGAVSRRLRERLDPSVRLHATDLSAAMLAYARAEVPGAIEWSVADAAALPFPDAACGVVVCAFGIMFVPDKLKAFREMRRVLQPGGSLLLNARADRLRGVRELVPGRPRDEERPRALRVPRPGPDPAHAGGCGVR